MRKAAILFIALVFNFISCNRQPFGDVTHRNHRGRPDQWLYRISDDEYKILIDTNGDGRPDLIRTYKDHQVIKIESDRNFNGKVDLVQEYSRGVLVREIHDD